KENRSIPIIAQTAYALKGEKELSMDAGCDDYIAKPIDITELMGLLSKYMP
ncbi:MAG: response regulator, partial [Bacteroidetes bacterium]